jgi:hypothetical protein
MWNYTTGGAVWSSPAVASGVVYVGSEDCNVYALNATTGTPLWKYTTGGPVESSPIVVNGVIYIGSNDGNIYAFGTNPSPRSFSILPIIMGAIIGADIAIVLAFVMFRRKTRIT